MTETSVLEIPAQVICPRCRAVPYVPQALDESLSGRVVPCPRCEQPLEWWRAIREGIAKWPAFGNVAVIAGARSASLELKIRCAEAVEVDLTTYGIPGDAEIVHLNLTGTGGIWPVLVHGNTAYPTPVRTKLWIYGRPTAEHEGTDEVAATALVVWFHHRADNTVEKHLVESARAYDAGRFDGVIVPANIAAESALTPVMTTFFEQYGSKNRVRGMLQNGATYSHQLNVLVNVVAEVAGVPRLPEEIRGLLDRLRKCRNSLAHEGACDSQTRETAADHLAAALALVRYAHVLETALRRLPKQPQGGLTREGAN